MKEVWPSLLLAFPVTLYIGVVVLGSLPSTEGVFGGMFVVMLLLAVLSALPFEPIHLWASVVLLGSTIVVLGALYLATGFGIELLAGSLLASPALLMGYATRPGGLGWRLLAFAVALTEGIGMLSAARALTTAVVPVTGAEFIREFVSLNITQITGLQGLLMSSGAPLPLRDFFDPVYVILAAIATAGILFTSLRPQTAWGEPLPAAGATSPASEVVHPPFDLGPDLEAALLERSSPQPAFGGWPPGVLALLGGCGAAVLVVAAAFLDPGLTLGLLAVGIVVGLASTIVVMRRPLPTSRYP